MHCSTREPSAPRRVPGWLALAALAWIGPLAAADVEGTLPARLPDDVSPVRYELTLEPDAAALTFAGHVSIDVTVHRETSRITLNAAELDITEARIDGTTRAEVSLDAERQTATLNLPAPVAPGPHELDLAFTGRINRSAAGLFALDYDTGSGPRRMLTMQLEPMDGRRVAPMWDEPAAKAVFVLEAVIPKDQVAYSNMPEASNRVEGDRRRVRFEPTPKMSSYLLHLSVGDLERVSRRVGGVDVGVVVRRGAASQAAYALESSVAQLPWFNDYFGTPYPLPKLDMIAAPGESSFFGAMENWGAILYFESILLVDPKRSSQSDRMNIFDTIAHEVSHQWFGNLVTMRWWDDLWLNEGFASWMASRLVDSLRPDWKPWLIAAAYPRETAMQLDAGSATRPILQPVESIDEASQAFDAIAYSKGQTVIRMIEDTVGEKAFRDGIRRYVKEHAYGNTVTDDLWNALGAASGQPITEIAHDFTRQPGVPLVSVDAPACREGVTTLTLRQSRFETDEQSTEKVAWHIPVKARAVDGGAEAKVIMQPGQPATLRLEGCGPVLVNAGQAGYFRTLYGPDALESLRRSFARLPEIDQLGLLSDTYSLGGAGRLPATTYLDFVGVVPLASDPLIWSQVADKLKQFDRVLDGSPEQDAWRGLARALLQPKFAEVGWTPRPGESDTTAVLREGLISSLSALGDEAVIDESRARVARASADPAALPAAIRGTVLGVVALHADEATWESMRRQARAEPEPDEKGRMYARLGAALDPTLARRALDLALSGEPPTTIAPRIIARVADRHPAVAFDFAVANEEKLLGMIEASSRYSFIPSLPRTSADPALAERLRAYLQSSVPETARRDGETVVAEILRRSRSYAYTRPELEAWVKARTSGACAACRSKES